MSDAYPIAANDGANDKPSRNSNGHNEKMAIREYDEPSVVLLLPAITWKQSLQSGWSEAPRMQFYVREVLLGAIICMAQIPESIAFAYLAHVRPPVALHAAWVIGLLCALLGGRPGMVNGATGAFAAIVATFLPLPETEGGNGEGIELLFPSVMLAGVLMLVAWCES